MMLLGVSARGWRWMSIAKRRIGKKGLFLSVRFIEEEYLNLFPNILRSSLILKSSSMLTCSSPKPWKDMFHEKRALTTPSFPRNEVYPPPPMPLPPLRCSKEGLLARRRRERMMHRVKYCSMCGVGMAFWLGFPTLVSI